MPSPGLAPVPVPAGFVPARRAPRHSLPPAPPRRARRLARRRRPFFQTVVNPALMFPPLPAHMHVPPAAGQYPAPLPMMHALPPAARARRPRACVVPPLLPRPPRAAARLERRRGTREAARGRGGRARGGGHVRTRGAVARAPRQARGGAVVRRLEHGPARGAVATARGAGDEEEERAAVLKPAMVWGRKQLLGEIAVIFAALLGPVEAG